MERGEIIRSDGIEGEWNQRLRSRESGREGHDKDGGG